jgi:hypothetical protein
MPQYVGKVAATAARVPCHAMPCPHLGLGRRQLLLQRPPGSYALCQLPARLAQLGDQRAVLLGLALIACGWHSREASAAQP